LQTPQKILGHRGISGQFDGPSVGVAGLRGPPRLGQQMSPRCPGRLKSLDGRIIDRVQRAKPRVGPVDLAVDGRRGHRRPEGRCHPQQGAVQSLQRAQVYVALRCPGAMGRLDAFLRWGQDPAGATWIPLTHKLSFAAASLTLLGLAAIRRTRVEAALFWALVAAFMGLRRTGNDEPLFYFGAAGLILFYAVLEHGYEIAHRDELTGLPGRRALKEVMLELGGRYAVAMCDVDHFKTFNDTFGHEAGDQVLRFIGSKLSQVGGGARAFRYGGEEFTVVFPGRSAEEAQPFVESLREAIATSSFGLRAPGRPEKKREHASEAPIFVTITISIGVAENSKKLSTPELVLEAADGALYRAKESGRNCVRLSASFSALGSNF